MKIVVTEQNVPREYADSGLDAITVEGNRLSVDGWYDGLMVWSATVTLTDEQRRALHDALGDREYTEPREQGYPAGTNPPTDV